MNKKLIVGADPFPPYQYYDEEGNLRGSDYDLVKNAFNNAGYEIEAMLDEWSGIETALAEKRIDAAFQVQRTPEREKKYCFSDLLRNATTEIVTGDNTLKLDSYSDISAKGLSVGVMDNYSYGSDIDRISPSLKKSFGGQNELLKAINDRVVDIGVFDKGVKEYLVKKEGFENIFSIKNLEFIRSLYVVFNNAELRDAFNQGMKRMKQSL